MTAAERTTYRALLRRELEERSQRNPRYSLRSFARDLKIAPARLSDVLRGRYGLSRKSAEEIGKQLGWNEQEINLFCDLVDSEHSRNKKLKEEARQRILLSKNAYQQLTLDAFQVISDWYHYAILELTLVKGFQSDLKWIGKRLGISSNIVTSAIERLKRLDLIEEKSGKLCATDTFTASPSGIPSDALKKFHRQLLEKALAAIYLQTVEERDLSAMILAVAKKDVPEAKEAIKNFRRTFDSKFGKAKQKDEVYCLTTQFFSLEERSSLE
jgi:uncharacterized protein (TIGR02147 family)